MRRTHKVRVAVGNNNNKKKSLTDSGIDKRSGATIRITTALYNMYTGRFVTIRARDIWERGETKYRVPVHVPGEQKEEKKNAR